MNVGYHPQWLVLQLLSQTGQETDAGYRYIECPKDGYIELDEENWITIHKGTKGLQVLGQGVEFVCSKEEALRRISELVIVHTIMNA